SVSSRSGGATSPLTISFKQNNEPHTGEARGVRRGVHAAFADEEEEVTHTKETHKAAKEKKEKDKEKEREKKDKSKEESKCAEEKRRHIKSLIDKIPTQKEQLFQYKLDTEQIDNTLMEKKIRPWINKKIIEYIGEPEPTLVDFICSKVLAGAAPAAILDDVCMVLDEEAEVFVVKMWRLLIYELEAKKAGLVKTE
ncbi:hypothetical protein JYU34_022014, partial [Plutella xylostella]